MARLDAGLEMLDGAAQHRQRVLERLGPPVTWFQVGIVSSPYQLADT